jgi:cyclopropane-fatty-acyl-phospholipid synthase
VFGIDKIVSPWTRVFVSLAKKMRVGQLSLVLPDGSNTVFSGSSRSDIRAVLNLHRPEAVRKVLLGGARGFGEAYMDGDWDTPDLSALLKLAHANEPSLGAQAEGVAVALWIDRLRHRLRANSRWGSRRNIAYHYDLGNGFYRHWLDPSMTYSSGLFHAGDESLESAQRAKYRRLADMLDLRPGQRILEIGCGWGAFAVMAARDYGCHVTAITLSKRQLDHGRRVCPSASTFVSKTTGMCRGPLTGSPPSKCWRPSVKSTGPGTSRSFAIA